MKKTLAFFLAVFVVAGISCKKERFEPTQEQTASGSVYSNVEEEPYCYDCDEIARSYTDTVDHPTVLGNQIVNPYTIPNMQRAFQNIFGFMPERLPVTHLYVMFMPRDYYELDELEESCDSIELFDYPLDYDLVFEGDYYSPPGNNIEDIPPFYAVVPADFRMPSSVTYRVLEEMYIPDNVPEWEDEALYITNNLDEPRDVYVALREERIQYYQRYPPMNTCDITGSSWNPGDCGGGGGGISGGTSQYVCSHYPKGRILVQNNLTGNTGFRGLRQARVVIRRTFKVSRVYTNDNGDFMSDKYFANKYTILTKFRNQYAEVSRMRPWAIWEQFFPIKINFGKWKNMRCGQEFKIYNPGSVGTIEASHWTGAVVHNGVIEQREMCQQEGVGTPPTGLHIMVSSKRPARNGNTYMLNKIMHTPGATVSQSVLTSLVSAWQPAVGLALTAIVEIWKARAPDVKYGYGADPSDLQYFKTDQYTELVYHELSHASHYSAVGTWYWIDLGWAEYKNPHLGPGGYGPCCTQYAPIISIAEGWAYHMGHYLSDKKWGMQSTTFPEQGDFATGSGLLYFNNSATLSSHRNFLEDFNPSRAQDPNAWIPKGVMNDLMDSGIDPPASAVIDNVSGYTNAQFYQALAAGVRSTPEFKNTLLQQNGYWQMPDVLQLFSHYNY